MDLFIAIAVCICIAIVALAIRRAAKRKAEVRRGWRVRVLSKYVDYEECSGDSWVGISLEQVPYDHGRYCVVVPSVQNWNSFPSWARARREEIILRIKSDSPRLEYVNEDP